MANESSSLDVVLDQAHRILDVQLRYFEALDSRSGIVLGFAGTVVALASGASRFVLVGRGLAAIAALVGLMGFATHDFPGINQSLLQVDYAEADTRAAKAGLIAMQGTLILVAERQIRGKARRLRTATAILVIAIFFVAAGGGR